MPPNPAKTMLSVRNCRTILLRAAPKAVRTDISIFRRMPRTNRRLAILAQAMRRTSAEAPIQDLREQYESNLRLLNAGAARGQDDVRFFRQAFVLLDGKYSGFFQPLPYEGADLVLKRG